MKTIAISTLYCGYVAIMEPNITSHIKINFIGAWRPLLHVVQDSAVVEPSQ